MIRIFDFVFAIIALVLLAPVMLIILLFIYCDTGKPIFIQRRLGRNKIEFNIYKFRTMFNDTESLTNNLVHQRQITRLGRYLRKTKLDELPQLFNVLNGTMSFVGPRPNLLNQENLIVLRNQLNVYDALPGITGLAQINGVDMSTPKKLARIDAKMVRTMNLGMYFKLLVKTALGNGFGDPVQKQSEIFDN